MKRIVMLLLMFLVSVTMPFGGERDWIPIGSAVPQPALVRLQSSTGETSVIHFEVSGFASGRVQTPRGDARAIRVERGTPVLVQGAPDLPKLTGSLIIPDTGEMRVDILEATFMDFEGIDLAPSKGDLMRDIDPASVPYVYGPAYGNNAFFPGKLAELREPYIVRDHRGQTVVVYPFQYNPVSRTLRVYRDLTVAVSPTGRPGKNPLLRANSPRWSGNAFSGIYRQLFLNAESQDSGLDDGPGPMLIICYGAFLGAIQPFVQWKQRLGFEVTVLDVANVGNAAAIKATIADWCRAKGLAYVLLVGDAAQVPTSSTSAGASDNDYSFVAGEDHYPDLCVGRFSAESAEEVETQVLRTIGHEWKSPRPQMSIALGVGLASSLGPGDDDEYDYEHIRRINRILFNDAHVHCFELFDGSQGGNDAAGAPTPEMVAQAVNAGATIINYAGHGGAGGWTTSGFSISDISRLANALTLPVIWSVACKNGDFVDGTCFAESWLRATSQGLPVGAVAFLGSTIIQSWSPPMCGQDEMNALLAEASARGETRRFGPLSMTGCMKMNDEYGPAGEAMTDTWTCFGDPSLMVFRFRPGFSLFGW